LAGGGGGGKGWYVKGWGEETKALGREGEGGGREAGKVGEGGGMGAREYEKGRGWKVRGEGEDVRERRGVRGWTEGKHGMKGSRGGGSEMLEGGDDGGMKSVGGWEGNRAWVRGGENLVAAGYGDRKRGRWRGEGDAGMGGGRLGRE